MEETYGKLGVSLTILYVWYFYRLQDLLRDFLFFKNLRYKSASDTTFVVTMQTEIESNLELCKFILTTLCSYLFQYI